MAFEYIRSETTEDGVLVLTLHDPATRNALGGPLSEELEGEVHRFGHDPALRVLVLTGADPAFCSGANVRGFHRAVQEREAHGPPPPPGPWELLDPAYLAESLHEAMGPALVRQLWNLQKPTIAAVNGAAYGLGCRAIFASRAVQSSGAACGPDGHDDGAGDAASAGADLCHVPDQDAGA